MDILSISIIFFCVMEFSNVLILYFKPDSKLGNGLGVFNTFKNIKKDEELKWYDKSRQIKKDVYFFIC